MEVPPPGTESKSQPQPLTYTAVSATPDLCQAGDGTLTSAVIQAAAVRSLTCFATAGNPYLTLTSTLGLKMIIGSSSFCSLTPLPTDEKMNEIC